MKTIKIIDLLNKIANGEEVPLKIEYKGEIYNRQQNTGKNSLYYYQVLGQCKFLVEQLSSVNDLIDEVEILEEENKIPEKLDLYEDLQDILNSADESVVLNAIHKSLTCEKIKINEIIDYLKSKGE